MSDVFPTRKDYLTGFLKVTVTGALLTAFFFIFFSGSVSKSPDMEDEEAQVSSITNRARERGLRIQSIAALAAMNPERLMPLLVNIVRDEREEPLLRYHAAEKMALLDERGAKTIYEGWLEDRKEDLFVRKTAIAQLAAVDKNGMRKRIPKILGDSSEDPSIRQYALGLYVSASGEDAVPELRRIASNKAEPVPMRANALFELESLEDFDFVQESLRKYLKSRTEPEDLRKNCLTLAENIKDRESLPLMLDIAADASESAVLRQLALAPLGRMGDTEMLARLEFCLDREMNTNVRRALEDTVKAIKARSGGGK